MHKIRVGVIYGGKSGEHEVSIASAASIFKYLDRNKYESVPILIGKDGRWALAARAPELMSAADVHAAANQADPTRSALQVVEPTTALTDRNIDVVFPVLHGPYGEDGTVQGLFELANVPYVGAGVLGSAAGMDKAVMKTLFQARGLPVGPYLVVLRREWDRDSSAITTRVGRDLGYPVFVKPANLGSSVGISKAKTDDELAEAMRTALQFDRKIVIEAAVPRAREIECAVLGNDDPQASIPGEIVTTHEFYDYAAKYLDTNTVLEVPAKLRPETVEVLQRMAVSAFRTIDGEGMARIDFFVREPDDVYVNEINTIPGFTSVSMYPRMWQASGLTYGELVDRLIELALERHDRESRRGEGPER